MKVEAKFCEATEFEVTVMNYTKAELLGILGEFKGRITKGEDGEKYFISAYAEYGDYDDSCEVERANVRVLQEAGYPAGSMGWGEYGHVYYAIEIDPDLMDREQWNEVIEIFRELEDYPCIDDEAMGEVMMEAVDEAWNDWIYSDFLGKVADTLCHKQGWYTCDIEHSTDLSDAVRVLFDTLCNAASDYPIMEAGGGVWIDLDKLVKNGQEEITLANLASMGLEVEGE